MPCLPAQIFSPWLLQGVDCGKRDRSSLRPCSGRTRINKLKPEISRRKFRHFCLFPRLFPSLVFKRTVFQSFHNFMQWTLRRNAGAVHFTDEQMDWLRLIKDHIAASLSIEPSDLDLSPFDRKGGLGRFYEVFGEQYETVLLEMNIELVA